MIHFNVPSVKSLHVVLCKIKLFSKSGKTIILPWQDSNLQSQTLAVPYPFGHMTFMHTGELEFDDIANSQTMVKLMLKNHP